MLTDRHKSWIRAHTCYYGGNGRSHGILWDGGLGLAAAGGKRNHTHEWTALVHALQAQARREGWPSVAPNLPFTVRYPSPR